MRIAVDAMGGDRGPAAVMQGVLDALAGDGELEVTVLGDGPTIRDLLKPAGPTLRQRIFVVESTDDPITADEAPVEAVRRKPGASLVQGIALVASTGADALVSAGSTGALMASAQLSLGLLSGVSRPALGTTLRNVAGKEVLVLDVGANMDARPDVLAQYAVMASVYLRYVTGVMDPRIGLLNVGVEDGKGNRTTRLAHRLLGALNGGSMAENGHVHYVGNVESRELYAGRADAVVCDGFSGNLMLKALEGFGLMIREGLSTEFRRSPRSQIGALLVMPALRRLMKAIDYEETGGAPLFGPAGVVIKCHGSSGPRSISNGIRLAKRAVSEKMVERMSEAMGHLSLPKLGGMKGSATAGEA